MTKARVNIIGTHPYIFSVDADGKPPRDEEGNLYTTSVCVKAALKTIAAKYLPSGAELVDDQVWIEPDRLLFEDSSLSTYRVGGAASGRTLKKDDKLVIRPMLSEWELTFDLTVKDEVPDTVLLELLNQAGKMVGIGNFRPDFGRFRVQKYESVR